MSENGSTDLEGVNDSINLSDLERAGLLVAKSPRFQMNVGVLRRQLTWLFVLMVVFHCLWVWKGRTDVSEWVYRLGRGQ